MLRILLVDDEREEREGIAFLIKKYQYPLAVVQAQNGAKALEYMEEHPVDIVFSDVKMPVMNGLDLARAVNRRFPETKIIIFSAYGEFDYAKQALEANAVNYLLKPIEVEEFRRVMDGLICTIQEEQSRREKQRQEKWENWQNILYRIFTGARVQESKRQRVQESFFEGKNACRLVHVEFMDQFFQQYEEVFLSFVRMYLGNQTRYVNLFPNEAYLMILEKKYEAREFLEEQLRKLSRDVQDYAREGMVAIVGRPVKAMEQLEEEVGRIQEIQRELFGFDGRILWTEEERTQKYYSRDVESIRSQLMQAIESSQTELIREFAGQLVEAVKANHMVSKIYVQNLFYTVLQSLYSKNPDIRQEKILDSMDHLFYARSPRETIDLFWNCLEGMLDSIRENQGDDPGVIQKIRNLVEKEYMYDISLNDVAERVNLAPAYVSYVFKRDTGKTLIKYITEVKMEKAGLLLTEGKLKIIQIARACGYENQSYFNRTFKNYFGVTPKQFKERQKG